MTELELKTELHSMKVGDFQFYYPIQFSSGYLHRVLEMVREETGRKFSTLTNPSGMSIERIQ